MEDRLKDLRNEIQGQNRRVKELRDEIQGQTDVLPRELSEIKILIKELIHTKKQNEDIIKVFPLQTADQLAELDLKLKSRNNEEYINRIREIIEK